MTVKFVQWRAVIGIFNCRSSAMSRNLTKNFASMFEVLLLCWHYFESAFIFLLTLVYMLIILQCHGDIEPNPGPRKLKLKAQLKAYNSIYKYDFICYLKHTWILQFLII